MTLYFFKLDLCTFQNWLTDNLNKSLEALKLSESSDYSNICLIEDSFSIDLRQNPTIRLDSRSFLSHKIKLMIENFQKYNYYAPYTVVCQSSGFGKSRACTSLAEIDFYVVYCCLRKKDSTGYPKRSCLADNLLSTESDIKNYFKCYFGAFIELLNETQIDCKEFFRLYQQDIDPNKNLALKLVNNKWTSISAAKINIPEYTGCKPLIFVFDEASNLLNAKNGISNYFELRSLLSELRRNMFVLFLDTFSHLSEFMPSTSRDPSSRICTGVSKIFEPIYLLPNWDLFGAIDSICSIKDSIKFENICKYGRPLWGSWMHTRTNSNGKYESIDYKNLYYLAVAKLIGSKSFEEEYDENDCLAVLSSRIGTIKPKCLSSCQEMVAKNMAVCTYVDNENDIFEIDYPSEPILAEAAAFLINNIKSPEFFVKKLIYLIESSIISKGDKGEIIAKLILLQAKDKSISPFEPDYPLKFSKLVYVGEFVKNVYGECENKECGNFENNWICNSKKELCCLKMIKQQLKNANILLNGFVNFTHFSRPKEFMDKTSLIKALKRCAAYHCKMNQKPIDLVIPVSLNENNFDLISVVVVQVKLWSESYQPSYPDIVQKIDINLFSDISKNVPYLVLYMQLGAPKLEKEPFVKSINSKIQNQATIFSQGISRKIFPKLNKSLVTTLKAFAVSNEKLLKLKNDKKYVQIYNLIRYI